MSFSKLGLSEDLVRAVTEHGYTQPTPIQTQAIPAVLAGGDLLAGAQTGTGKTAGFVLPMLQRLSHSVPSTAMPSGAAKPGEPKTFRKPLRALILTPTRELAAQVEESVRVYGKHVKLSSTVIYGGVGINPQIAQLKRGVDILVATPGRLLDLQQQNAVDLRHVEILVLDEADRMLDMGFIKDIRRILALLPKKRQNLLFSATFSDEIKELADQLLNAPAMIEVARRNSTVEMISQRVHPVDRDRNASCWRI
jgi:ATP-dependent RNA helicase RhlE